MADVPELKILKVELVEQSYKTHRVTHGQHPENFPVLVWFTRPLNAFERAEIANHGLKLQVHEDDPQRALAEVSPTHFVRQIDTINAELPAVEADAQKAREAAQAEDEHIAALVQRINLNINPEH
jgi:hypothetical protein